MEQQPQAADPLESFLRSAPLNDRQRAGLWDMYEESRNPDDLAARLKSVQIPEDVKAQLWDLKSQAAPQPGPPSHGASGSWQPNTWADSLGLNAPTDSMLTGFLRGSGAAALDMTQGAVADVRNRVNRGGDPLMRAILAPGAVDPAQAKDVMQAPDTVPGKIGGYLPHVAEMAVGTGGAAKAAVNAIPRAARAGQKFQEVSAAAKDVIVETKEVGDAALRIFELSHRGGRLPKAVNDLLKRLTAPPKKGMPPQPGMAYPESRDFASNISRLSADEMQSLTPVMKREVANLRVVLNKANAEAAKAAGKGAEYKEAMREYAKAMQLREALDVLIRKAKKAALPAAGLGGAAYWFGRD